MDNDFDQSAILRRRGAYLPHWRIKGGIYAVTFRLADSLPSTVRDRYVAERSSLLDSFEHDARVTALEGELLRKLFSEKIDAFLDRGCGKCYLSDPRVGALVQQSLLHFHQSRYLLYAWCMMPNHVHAVLRPLGNYELDKILHSWKSFTATAANKLLGRQGPFWRVETYDHLVRDLEDFQHAIGYVINNPAAAGLMDWAWVGVHEDLVNEVAKDAGGF